MLYYPDAKGEHWHLINLNAFCKREKILGMNFVKLIQKHPELLQFSLGIPYFNKNKMKNDVLENNEKVAQIKCQ